MGILLESNIKEIKQNGAFSSEMNFEVIIKKFKLLYCARKELIAYLLVWTLILLCKHPKWQARVKDKVLQTFGNKILDIDCLNQLKSI